MSQSRTDLFLFPKSRVFTSSAHGANLWAFEFVRVSKPGSRVCDIVLRPLYNAKCRDSIVFVHSLDGHRIITWSIRDEAADANLSLQSAETHDRNKMGSPQPLQSLQLRKRTSSGFSAKRQLCWPRDLLPMDVDDCRILSWGYDTSLISSSRLRVDDHAKSLLQDLTFARYKEFEVGVASLCVLSHAH